MRIGFDAKRLFLNDRGLGNYSRTLVNGLLTHTDKHDIFLYSPKIKMEFLPPGFLEQPFMHTRIPHGANRWFNSYWRTFVLGQELGRDNLDIFHGLSHEIPYNIKKSNVKFVVSIHDLIFVKHPEFYQPIDRWIYYQKVKHAIKYADKIIAISEQTKLDILNEFSIDPDRIQVIYQSCNEVFYQNRTGVEKKATEEKFALPKRFILFVGALNSNKNVNIIIDALCHAEVSSDLHLVIVGTGAAYKKLIMNNARKRKMINRVHFASDKSNPTPIELSAIYQLAKALVFPSIYEGFGIPILEARFSGIPVLASNSSCLHEAGGNQSQYFNPKDADQLGHLINLVENDAITYDRNPPNKFRIDRLTQDLLTLYSELKNQ